MVCSALQLNSWAVLIFEISNFERLQLRAGEQERPGKIFGDYGQQAQHFMFTNLLDQSNFLVHSTGAAPAFLPNFAKSRGLTWTSVPHISKLGPYPKDGPIKVPKEEDDFQASPINKLY